MIASRDTSYKARTEDAKLNHCSLIILVHRVSKQFANLKGGNGMQKKRMQNKRMQIKPTSYVSKMNKSTLPSITFILNVLSENVLFLSE